MASSYENIYLNNNPGTFKFNQAGFGWKRKDVPSEVVTAYGTDLRRVQWCRAARGYRLKLFLKSDSSKGPLKEKELCFENFREMDLPSLKDCLKGSSGVSIEELDLAVKGWNWGKYEIQQSSLYFMVNNKEAFEIPMSQLSNVVMPGKNEVALEFASSGAKGMELSEMRFFIPNVDKKEDKEEKPKAAEGEEADEDSITNMTPAEAFHKAVKDAADIGGNTGDAVASFVELQCLYPRGRFEVELFPTLFRLHGKTYDYQVKYDGVSNLFLLEREDKTMLFVVGLEPPIRQGQTRYQFLVFQFHKDEELEIKLNITEEEIEENYRGKLRPVYKDVATFQVVSEVFVALSKKKLHKTGGFINCNGNHDLKCSLKANEGWLFPLEKAFLFIPKSPTLIKYSDIVAIQFPRGAPVAAARSFDMKVETTSGDFLFSNIMRGEFSQLFNFLEGKRLNLPSRKELEKKPLAGDAEFEGGPDDDDEEDAKPARRAEGDGFGEDSESEDEDFAPGGDDESDVGEEYDEEFGVESDEHFSSDDEKAGMKGKKDQEKKEKKDKKDKKETKKRKRESEDEDEEEEEEEEKAPKKAKKTKKTKDPNAPKAPSSAFLLYSRDNRARVSKGNTISIVEVTKILAEEWRNLDADKKKEYQDMYIKDKERYNEEMKSYVPSESTATSKPKSEGKSKPKPKPKPKAEPKPSKGSTEKRQMADMIDDDDD